MSAILASLKTPWRAGCLRSNSHDDPDARTPDPQPPGPRAPRSSGFPSPGKVFFHIPLSLGAGGGAKMAMLATLASGTMNRDNLGNFEGQTGNFEPFWWGFIAENCL